MDEREIVTEQRTDVMGGLFFGERKREREQLNEKGRSRVGRDKGGGRGHPSEQMWAQRLIFQPKLHQEGTADPWTLQDNTP